MIAVRHWPRLPQSRPGVGQMAPVAVLVLLTLGLLVRPFAHAVDVWETVGEFSFGYFVPVVSLGLVWWHRAAIRRSIGAGSWTGLLIVGGALVMMTFGYRMGVNVIGGLSVIPLLFGMVVYLWGWQAAKVLAFPIGFLVFGLGLYRGLLSSVGFAMQGYTASGAAFLGRTLGLPVVQDGVVLKEGTYTFIVAEACSGMSSLVSLLSLAALWLHVMRAPMVVRAAVMVSVLPVVLVANSTRVATVLLTGWWYGPETAIAYFEKSSNIVLFGVALAGLLAISTVATRVVRAAEQRAASRAEARPLSALPTAS